MRTLMHILRKQLAKNFMLKKYYRIAQHRLSVTSPFRDQWNLLGKEANTILDVGANVGGAACVFRSFFPSATIHCFEPTPESYSILYRNLRRYSNIRLIQAAASDVDSIVTLHLNSDNQTNSLFPYTDECQRNYFKNCGSHGYTDVKAITIDNYSRNNDIKKIDILKLDTQGAELRILNGSANMLSNNRINLIFCELLFVPYYTGGSEFHEVVGFLSEYGYKLFRFYELHHRPNGQLIWGDAVFMSPSIRQHTLA